MHTVHSAQKAADQKNFATCRDRFKTDLGIAPLDVANLALCRPLFGRKLRKVTPRARVLQSQGPKMHLQSQQEALESNPRDGGEDEYREDSVVATLRRVRRVKVTGPFVDSTNTLHALSLKQDKDNDEYHHAVQVGRLLEYVCSGRIPESLRQSVSLTYFLALYKDEADKTKLRPIKVGTALRRVAASHLCRIYQHQFAEHVLPNNWAIRIKDGSNFIVNTMQAQVDKHVNPQDPFVYDSSLSQFLCLNLLPTRVLVSLDIKNMFNSILREHCCAILVNHFSRLVPFFNLLYKKDNLCHYIADNGKWGSFSQEEGFAQGCPFSPAFSALVLQKILSQLDMKLRAEAKKRLRKSDKGNDGYGGVTHILAYVDDTSAVILYSDVELFCRRFAELGEPLGCALNPVNTKILTSTNGLSPLPFLSKRLLDPVNAAIEKYVAGEECTEGVCLLGFRIGGPSFAKKFLEATLIDIGQDVLRFTTKLEDLQTMLQVYKESIITKFPYVCLADVYHNEAGAGFDPFAWSSPFLRGVANTTKKLLSHLTGRESVPAWVLLIAHLCIGEGGLGILDRSAPSVPLFVQSVTSSARYARTGVPLKHLPADRPHLLPVELQELYADLEGSTVKHFCIYEKYARLCFATLYPDSLNLLLHALTEGDSTKWWVPSPQRDGRRAWLPFIMQSPPTSGHTCQCCSTPSRPPSCAP